MDEIGHVSVETLFRDMAEQLGLQWLAGRNGGQRSLSSETIQKPTLALIGHLNFVHPNQVQVLGPAEMDYLRSLSESALQDAIDHLFSTELAAIVVSNGEAVPAALLDSAPDAETDATRSWVWTYGGAASSSSRGSPRSSPASGSKGRATRRSSIASTR